MVFSLAFFLLGVKNGMSIANLLSLFSKERDLDNKCTRVKESVVGFPLCLGSLSHSQPLGWCLPSSSSPAERQHLPPLSLYSLRTKSASLTENMAEFLEFCCAWICFHFQVTTFVVVCSSFFPPPTHSILGVVVLLLMRTNCNGNSRFFAEFDSA